MKRSVGVILSVMFMALGLMITGCGPKPAAQLPVDAKARQLLIEGTVLLKQGELMKAVENFAGAIKVSPDYFEAYYMLGETFIRVKQFEQARAVLNAAVNRFPDNPVAFYMLSLAYEGSDNMMPAIVTARKSIDLFRARKDETGEKRATILLGVLIQKAKQQEQDKMVAGAAEDAAVTTPETLK